MRLHVEIEREDDGRWIGEVPALPGVLAYGATENDARAKAAALALRVLADRLEHGEQLPPEASESRSGKFIPDCRAFAASGGLMQAAEMPAHCG
jgi:predicted RNase H-like HicB family nuclease